MIFKAAKERGNDFPAPLQDFGPHAQAREAEHSALLRQPPQRHLK
jgi:hypothetical protein